MPGQEPGPAVAAHGRAELFEGRRARPVERGVPRLAREVLQAPRAQAARQEAVRGSPATVTHARSRAERAGRPRLKVDGSPSTVDGSGFRLSICQPSTVDRLIASLRALLTERRPLL